jgi:hypothetical protein
MNISNMHNPLSSFKIWDEPYQSTGKGYRGILFAFLSPVQAQVSSFADLQEAVDSFERQLASMSDVIQGRLNAIHDDMAVAGISRSVIPEETGDESEFSGFMGVS